MSVPPLKALTVQLAPAAVQQEVGQSAVVRATWQEETGQTLRNVPVTWTQRRPAVVSLGSATSDSVVVTGLAPGVDTVTVLGSRDGLSATGTLVVSVVRRSAVRLTVTPGVLYLPAGQSLTLAAEARDTTGAQIADAPVYVSTNPAVVTVTPAGVVTAVASGTARVLATLDRQADTVDVTVTAASQGVWAITTGVLSPTVPLRVTGPNAASVRATVNGVSAVVTAVQPTVADIQVPASLFEPCLRAGVVYPVVLRRGTDSLVVSLPAEAKPVVVSLAVGQYAAPAEAIANECPVEVAQAGTYLVMPYRYDTPAGWTKSFAMGTTDTVAIDLVLEPTVASRAPFGRTAGTVVRGAARVDPGAAVAPMAWALGAEVSGRSDPTSGVVSRPVDRWARAARLAGVPLVDGTDVVLEPVGDRSRARWGTSAAVTATACRVVTQVGDSMMIRTLRNAQGQVNQLAGYYGVGEPWKVVASGTRIVALADTSAIRLMRPWAYDSIRALVAAYDSTIAPTYEAVFDTPLPDQDGNGGRIVMLLGLNNGIGASGLAYPTSTAMRADCTDPGEYLWLNVTSWTKDNAGSVLKVAQAAQTLSHEAMHVHDIARWPSTRGASPWWVVEGTAELGTWLWVFQHHPQPVTGRMTSIRPVPFLGYARIPTCFTPMHSGAMAFMYRNFGGGYPSGYQVGCAYVMYLLQRHMAAGQGSLRAAVSAWSRMGRTPAAISFGAVASEYLGAARTDDEFFREWLLSVYATAYVPGISAGLDNLAWDPRAVVADAAVATFPLPEVSVGPARTTLALTVAEPQARYVEASLAIGGRLLVRPTGGTGARTNLRVAVLRAR